MDTTERQERESIIQDIVTLLQKSPDKITDTKKVKKIRDDINTLICTEPETKEERQMRKNLSQKRYREENREQVNERKRRARLGEKMKCMVLENVIIK